MTSTILIGLLIPLLGTMLGASFVFFMRRDMPAHELQIYVTAANGEAPVFTQVIR